MAERQRSIRSDNLLIAPDYNQLSKMAADLITDTLKRKPSAVIGLPTGRTPLGAYRRLGELVRGGLNTSGLRVVALDEYLGVSPDEPISLFAWLHRTLLQHLQIPSTRVLRMPADDPQPQLACAAFDRRLERLGGFDLVVLGLGWNGHVAFNEPGSPPAAPTRVVALQPGTIKRNVAYWRSGPVPAFGVTIGMRQILRAKRILLIVSGSQKARILSTALRGAITPNVPASLLRRGRLTVLADRAAGKDFQRAH